MKDYTDREATRPYDPTLKDHARWVFEPHVAMRVTMRMLEEAGLYVISQNDVRHSPEKDAPVVISSFPIDSHDCQRLTLKGGGAGGTRECLGAGRAV